MVFAPLSSVLSASCAPRPPRTYRKPELGEFAPAGTSTEAWNERGLGSAWSLRQEIRIAAAQIRWNGIELVQGQIIFDIAGQHRLIGIEIGAWLATIHIHVSAERNSGAADPRRRQRALPIPGQRAVGIDRRAVHNAAECRRRVRVQLPADQIDRIRAGPQATGDIIIGRPRCIPEPRSTDGTGRSAAAYPSPRCRGCWA